MKKWMIGILVIIVTVGLGVGGAFLFNSKLALSSTSPFGQYGFSSRSGGQMPGFRQDGRMGQQGGWMNPQFQSPSQDQNSGTRISEDTAVDNAKAYLKNYTEDLKVSEVMEFQDNFYILVKESATGRGAMELLVDPISGNVSPEIGPNMMWNLKYGRMNRMMGTSNATDNSVSIEDALAIAQSALNETNPAATVNSDGVSFYGYYTFDYSVDGEVAGMLSVNGIDGQVWVHSWHGDFISEKEID